MIAIQHINSYMIAIEHLLIILLVNRLILLLEKQGCHGVPLVYHTWISI